MRKSRQDERTRRLSRESRVDLKSGEGRLRVALAFPNTYPVGMSTLGFHLVYNEFNNHPNVVCERAFIPEPNGIWTSTTSTSRLTSLETDTLLVNFDVLAFSIHFEMDYWKILQLLDMAGIPRLASERTEASPLILAGGPCASANPEPIADFVDAFALGDAEELADCIADALLASKSRQEALESLSQIPGVYVPSFYAPKYADDGTIVSIEPLGCAPRTVRRNIARLSGRESAFSAIRTPDTEFGDISLVEVIRGCGRKCRFCLACYTNLPSRPRFFGMPKKPETIGLVGASALDHPNARAICKEILDSGCGFTVSSLRAESLDAELASMISQGGQRTLTLAPEAGTLRLRRVINKAAEDDVLIDCAKMAGDAGFSKLKLYFMVGLPTETDEDIQGITDLASKMALACGIPVELSVSVFVPKPQTPFQWTAMPEESILKKRLSLLRGLLKKVPGIKADIESPRNAVIQGVLSRGDRKVSELVLAAFERGGNWRAALCDTGIDAYYYIHRERSLNEVLPWDHLDSRVKKEFLQAEYERALREETTPDCEPGACFLCGACDDFQDYF